MVFGSPALLAAVQQAVDPSQGVEYTKAQASQRMLRPTEGLEDHSLDMHFRDCIRSQERRSRNRDLNLRSLFTYPLSGLTSRLPDAGI